MFFFHYYRQSIIFCIIFLTVIYSTILSIGEVLAQWAYQYFLQISVGIDQWSGKIGSFNNRIVSNLLFCTYLFNKVYKTLLPVFCFLFVVILCVLFWKCSNALLKFSPKQLCLEFQHELLFCSYLAILSIYLTWCITTILLSGDVEINPGSKSSSRECFSLCHCNLNSISAQSYTKVSLLTGYKLS